MAITVISCGVFAARGASALIASQALAPSSIGPRVPPPVVAAVAPAPARPSLVARNMFCAACGVTAGAPERVADRLSLPAILIATQLGDEPYATLRVVGSDVQGSWGTGDEIPGLGRVHHIAPQWVEIATATGQLGRLRLDDHVPAAASGPDSARSAGPAAASPFGDRLVKLDATTYAVDRALIRELFGAGSSAGTGSVTGRLVPAMQDGKPVGVKVYGVRPGTIPFLLELQNGDQLEAINGTALTSANAMLGLYAGLDQLNVVELAITRHGQPLTRTLNLR